MTTVKIQMIIMIKMIFWGVHCMKFKIEKKVILPTGRGGVGGGIGGGVRWGGGGFGGARTFWS